MLKSEMMVVEEGLSQAHAEVERSQMLEVERHVVLGYSVQCHVGSASV